MDFFKTLMAGALAAAIAAAWTSHAHAAGSSGPGEEPALPALPTAQKKLEEREAKRREAALEHERKREEFERRCTAPLLSPAELEACRTLYREM